MADRIYLPEDLAEGKEVILVDGICYEKVGPSELPPDTYDVEDEFESCEACEDSSSKSSSTSDDGSQTSTGSGGDQSSTSDYCICTLPPVFSNDSGGSGGASWTSYPDELCKDDGNLTFSFNDPGTLGSNVQIKGIFEGVTPEIINNGGAITQSIDGQELTLGFGASTSRTITFTIAWEDPGIPDPRCIYTEFTGGNPSLNVGKIMTYPASGVI